MSALSQPSPKPSNNGISAVYDISKEFIWHLHTEIRMRAYACACACAFTTTVNSVRLSAAVDSRFPVPCSRLGSLGFYFPSCSLGQWGIKLPGLAFGRSRSAANWQGNGRCSRGFAIVVFIRFQNSTDIWSGTIGNAWFILRMIQLLKPEND